MDSTLSFSGNRRGPYTRSAKKRDSGEHAPAAKKTRAETQVFHGASSSSVPDAKRELAKRIFFQGRLLKVSSDLYKFMIRKISDHEIDQKYCFSREVYSLSQTLSSMGLQKIANYYDLYSIQVSYARGGLEYEGYEGSAAVRRSRRQKPILQRLNKVVSENLLNVKFSFPHGLQTCKQFAKSRNGFLVLGCGRAKDLYDTSVDDEWSQRDAALHLLQHPMKESFFIDSDLKMQPDMVGDMREVIHTLPEREHFSVVLFENLSFNLFDVQNPTDIILDLMVNTIDDVNPIHHSLPCATKGNKSRVPKGMEPCQGEKDALEYLQDLFKKIYQVLLPGGVCIIIAGRGFQSETERAQGEVLCMLEESGFRKITPCPGERIKKALRALDKQKGNFSEQIWEKLKIQNHDYSLRARDLCIMARK